MDIFAIVDRMVSIVSAPSAPHRRRRRRSVGLSFQILESRVLLSSTPSRFLDPHPVAGDQFGASVTTLRNGNVLITAPLDDAGGDRAGTVYLFNGKTGALISTLLGSHSDDLSTIDVTLLSNGNFVIKDSGWNGGLGAVIWGSETTGVSGTISSSNSLIIGSFDRDLSIKPLRNGNYLVYSPRWNNFAGAVTFGNGLSGVTGVVGSSNSLVGGNSWDDVGSKGIKVLSNGNYIVNSSDWNNSAGAVTFGDGANGVTGVVGSSNSLVGSNKGDKVGSNGIKVLSNGNYVVVSSNWNNGAGAVTFGNGLNGVAGVVGSSNSLVGSNRGDKVGSFGVTALSNGNYLVVSPSWNNSAGAVTFGNGLSGVTGVVGSSNSLVGSHNNDKVGEEQDLFGRSVPSVTALSNGNYFVTSPSWNDSTGAVTFGDGVNGQAGVVGSSNSLVGSKKGDEVGFDGVMLLSNGNYLVVSSKWNNGAGAVTFVKGLKGVTGEVGSSNSLVGSKTGDRVGAYDEVTILSNGNYVVASPSWNDEAGAVTFGDSVNGVTGVVGSSNSLVGGENGDEVGASVTGLSNVNYVVSSYLWNNRAGAVTFGNGLKGVTGVVGSRNSLVGSNKGDEVGSVTELSNSNYVVESLNWNNNAGAVTFGNGLKGVSGVVGSSNSLVGSHTDDYVGGTPDNFGEYLESVTALSNGNYVVASPGWNGTMGAVTFGDGVNGVTGVVGATNSLIGSHAGDSVGGYNGSDEEDGGVTALSNGNYVVASPYWNDSAGAVTFGSGVKGVTGVVGSSNSLVGSEFGDHVGGEEFFTTSGGVKALSNGNYVVASPHWHLAGAVTFGSGVTGVRGFVGSGNSLVGIELGGHVGSNVTLLNNGNYVVDTPDWNFNAGSVTFGSGATGVRGDVSAANSLVGSVKGDFLGGGGITALANGNYVVNSPNWNHVGVVTFASGVTGVVGLPSESNSVFGQTNSFGTQTFVIPDNKNGRFYAAFPNDRFGRVYRGSATTGFVSTPTVTVIDAGGVATGKPYPASSAATGWDGSAVPGLRTYTYYVGNKAIGTGTSIAPRNAGTYTVVANYASASPYYSNAKSAPLTFQITPAAASQVVFVTVPATGASGKKLTSVVALIEDAFGNVVTSDTSTVTISVKSGPGDFATGGTFSVSAVAGVATFRNLTLDTAGVYRLTATDGSLTAHVSGKLTIDHAAASKLVFIQAPSTGTNNALLTVLKVRVEDFYGNVVTDDASSITLAVSSSTAAGGAFTSDSTLTVGVVNGIATFTRLKLNKAGAYKLKATDDSLKSAVSGNLVIS